MQCPRCQQENPPQAKFCLECAMPLRLPPDSDGEALNVARRLTEALRREEEAREQQAATSDILRVISNSPNDVQPVFDAIVASAVRLCDAVTTTVFRFDGEFIHLVAAHRNVDPARLDALRQVYPRRPSRESVAGRVIMAGAVVHIDDVNEDPEYALPAATTVGFRSVLGVPMLREGVPSGVIIVARDRVAPFSDTHIALLKTFADQAVIAIENVRLFNETKEALEQQTATSEILRVISSSPTDIQPVFDMLARSARELCNGEYCVVESFDGERLHFGASDGLSPEGLAAFQQALPRPVSEDNAAGRAVLRRTVVQIPDVHADAAHGVKDVALAANYRSVVAAPMMRDRRPIGAIVVARSPVGFFPDRQVELLKTFADQAVIAIENVRLFNETKEALEQQTATSDILRVISSSPTDDQPVFDAIAESALRLCGAAHSVVGRYDGQLLHLAAHAHVGAEGVEAMRQLFPLRPSRRILSTRAILDRTVVHLPDVLEDAEYDRTQALALRNRAALAVPMLRNGEPIGTIFVGRSEPQPFTEAQIELLKTFADQAVIAIENVRLFKELETRNRDLTATGEILQVVSRSPTDTQPVFDTIAERAVNLCSAAFGAVFRFNDGWSSIAALNGMRPEEAEAAQRFFPRRVTGNIGLSRVALTGELVHIPDVQADPEWRASTAGPAFSVAAGFRTCLIVPLNREGLCLGAINVWRREAAPFSESQIALLQTFADQAVIAIENVRLFTELQEKNRALTDAHAQVSESLDQQTATAEILRIIAASPTDLRPVLDAMAENAARLCAANDAQIFRVEDGALYLAASFGPIPAVPGKRAINRQWVTGRSVVDRQTIHVHDLASEPDSEYPAGKALQRQFAHRTTLATPLLREGVALGAILIRRMEVRPFSDAQIALLETFADQAVIAIENVRLFKELEARTAALTRSVEQLTALGDVGRAVSSTLDLETVLTTIVSRAVQLSGLDGGVVFEYDEAAEEFVQRAMTDTSGALAEARRTTRIRKGEGVLGRTAITLEPVQVPDIAVPGAYEGRLRETLLESGVRAILAVPMMREGQLIGCLGVTRNQPGDFPAETIELLRTFATQSALAIQNARLFHEIEDKSRQLEAASRHKSEFLANMSHELRTPLNAIIGFSEVLSERMFGDLNEKQEEYLKDIYASGQHLLSLINDILDLSKIEAGRMELEVAEFSLPAAIDNALILVRERASRRGITLGRAIDDRVGMIRGDERKVKQVLLNLLSNALKFTPEGGRIDVRATVNDGMAEISVADTGVGIAPEDQEAIFEEFRQVGTADKKVEGTGLGLALSRKFIELHGGRIWVHSQPGKGSTFSFTLPAS